MSNSQDTTGLQNLAHLIQTGKLPEALELGEKLAALFPNTPAILSLLGSAYCMSGKFGDAEACYRNLILYEPKSPQHYYYLGLSMVMQEHLDEAVAPFKIMLQLAPDFANGHMQAGCLYRDLGNHTLAISHYRKAVSLSPSLYEATVFLANLLIYQDQMDEAMELYDQVLSRVPLHPGALAGKASLLEKQGRTVEAWECLSKTIGNRPVSPEVSLVYAKLAPNLGHAEQAISLLNEVLSNQSLAPSQTQEIHFALGSLDDLQGNYKKAFMHFQHANSLSPHHFDEPSMARRTQAIIRTFPGKTIPVADKHPENAPTPIFIVGMPRSGSSLVEQVLDCHPDVIAAGELDTLHQIEVSAQEITGRHTSYPECMEKASSDAINTMAASYLQTVADVAAGTRFVTDKLPTNFERLGLIERLFPDARVIHTTRQPLDICLSCYFQNFGNNHTYSSDLHNLAMAYKNHEELMAYWNRTLPIKIHEINYESLVSNPEQTVRELLDFCNLPWNPDCLEFHKSGRYIHTASYNQVRQPIYRSSAGRWKNYEPYIGKLIDLLQEPP